MVDELSNRQQLKAYSWEDEKAQYQRRRLLVLGVELERRSEEQLELG